MNKISKNILQISFIFGAMALNACGGGGDSNTGYSSSNPFKESNIVADSDSNTQYPIFFAKYGKSGLFSVSALNKNDFGAGTVTVAFSKNENSSGSNSWLYKNSNNVVGSVYFDSPNKLNIRATVKDSNSPLTIYDNIITTAGDSDFHVLQQYRFFNPDPTLGPDPRDKDILILSSDTIHQGSIEVNENGELTAEFSNAPGSTDYKLHASSSKKINKLIEFDKIDLLKSGGNVASYKGVLIPNPSSSEVTPGIRINAILVASKNDKKQSGPSYIFVRMT